MYHRTLELQTVSDRPRSVRQDVLWRAKSRVSDRTYDGYTETFYPARRVRVHIYVLPYPVIKRTPCGAWIYDDHNRKRFVNLQAEKRWAAETQEEAVESLRRRYMRRTLILRSQLQETANTLAALEGGTRETLVKLEAAPDEKE